LWWRARGSYSKAAWTMALRHVTKISSLTAPEITRILTLAMTMKAEPAAFDDALKRKTLLMLFEKPSLRTRVSLEVGMTQLGGHGIAYMSGDSPLGKKETYEDTGAVLSRMCDAVTARVGNRHQIEGLAKHSTIPVINALDDFGHPMQMLADLQTMAEHKRGGDATALAGLKFAYVGDCQNNVTYDLMRACALMGIDCRVAGPPNDAEYAIEAAVVDECDAIRPGGVTVCATAADAVAGADVVYADSWMSYGVDGEARDKRLKALMPFQVTADLMKVAAPDAVFMNCLPAMRGEEQTAEVIDGPQSIVFDQAENRLHAQKALLHELMLGRL